MEEHIIYVAGNPNLYPIEYYSSETKSFQGVIPELLKQFSEQSDYDIRYYKAGPADRRKQFAENLQTDIISGCTDSEKFENTKGKAVTVLETEKDGKKSSYNIFLSQSAPEAFEQDIRSYFEGVSQQTKTQLLVKNQQPYAGNSVKGLQAGVAALAITAALLIALIICLIFGYRKKLKKYTVSENAESVKGVGNKDGLLSAYAHTLNDKNKTVFSLVYFYIDIDGAERSGFDKISEFSKQTAELLQDCTEHGDYLAKLSDTEYALLNCSRNKGEYDWLISAVKKLRRLNESNENTINFAVGAGVYYFTDNNNDLERILFDTRNTAITACNDRIDFTVCPETATDPAQEENLLRADIRKGIENKEFELYIQFYINAKTFRNSGGEAILRWRHPQRGFLSADRFAPVVKAENLTAEMDYFLLEAVCGFLEDLDKDSIKSFFVSCNFSQDAFSGEDFSEKCIEIIKKYRVDKRLLIFGFCAGENHRDAERVNKNIQALREFGVQIMLDDFDDSISTVYELQKYTVDAVKLSKNLVEQTDTPNGRLKLATVYKIAHELDISVFASGIKNDEQRHALQEAECDMMQDLRFHFPASANEVKKQLKK